MLLVFVMSNELHWAEIGISQEIKWHPGITHRSNSLFVLSDNIPLFNKLCFYVQGFVMLGLCAISFWSHCMHRLYTGNLFPTIYQNKFKILYLKYFLIKQRDSLLKLNSTSWYTYCVEFQLKFLFFFVNDCLKLNKITILYLFICMSY